MEADASLSQLADNVREAPAPSSTVGDRADVRRTGSAAAAPSDPIIAVNDDFLRHVEAGDYIATIEPTRRLDRAALDALYERTLAALGPDVDIGVTMKRIQHVRANLAYYVAHFAAKPRVTYFCTDNAEEAIRMRLVLDRLGCDKRVLLLYACAPELADLYARYDIEPCVFDPWWIEQALRYRLSADKPLKIHVWVDVGMTREGILPADIDRILPLLKRDGVIVEGVATHFNCVSRDHAIQKARFEEVLQRLRKAGIEPRVVHAVASHNGLGYDDLKDALSPATTRSDVFYDMVRPGSSLGMGLRFDLEDHGEEVLRISIPVRAARIAHIKHVPAGWNLGYWSNPFKTEKRLAVLEGARLSSLRYETFARVPDTAPFRSMLCHGSIATIDVAQARVDAGDTLTSRDTMWFSLLTRDFQTTGDGRCVVTVRDAASGETRQLRIVAGDKTPNRQLFHNIDQMVSMLLNRHLECAARRKRMAWLARAVLTRAIFVGRMIVDRIPILARKASSLLAAISHA
jgi:hypothetical protein